MKKQILWIFLAFISMNAHGQIANSDIAACAVITGELERLECYDSIAREHDLDGPQPQTAGVEDAGDWNVRINENPLDDSKTVALILDAESGSSRFGQSIALVLRCMSDETNAYIDWNDYLGSEAYVIARVGSAEAERSRWSLSTDSQATFHPRAIEFIKSLIEVDRLVAQVTPYNESPVTAIFDLSGITNAIKPLRETCGW